MNIFKRKKKKPDPYKGGEVRMNFDINYLLKRKYELLEKNRALRKNIANRSANSIFGKSEQAQLESNIAEIAAIDHDLELLSKNN